MNLKDVLKPKSKEEIINLMDSLSAIDLLLKSSEAGFLPGIKKALKLGADIHYGQNIRNNFTMVYRKKQTL